LWERWSSDGGVYLTFVFPLQQLLTLSLVCGGVVGFSLLVVAWKLFFYAFETLDDSMAGPVAVHALELAAVEVGVLFVAAGAAIAGSQVALGLSLLDGLDKVVQVLIGQC
jgi:hypothetical protein